MLFPALSTDEVNLIELYPCHIYSKHKNYNKMKKTFMLISAIVVSGSLLAQVPNNGFETWSTVGAYNTPTGWDNLDSVTNAMSVFTCEKGSPGDPGASYIKLTSKTAGVLVAPGIAVSGKLDFTTYVPKSGFAYSSRPANLTGNWQYMASGADQGHIAVLLSKWNSAMSRRDTVSFTDHALPGMVMSWGAFTIPLTYLSAAVPDSAIIVLSASGSAPVNGSYLYVDNLAFSGSVPTGITNIYGNATIMTVYPNPTKDEFTISYRSQSQAEISVSISDITGRCIMCRNEKCTAGQSNFMISTANFAKGIFLVKVTDGQDTHVEKLFVE